MNVEDFLDTEDRKEFLSRCSSREVIFQVTELIMNPPQLDLLVTLAERYGTDVEWLRLVESSGIQEVLIDIGIDKMVLPAKQELVMFLLDYSGASRANFLIQLLRKPPNQSMVLDNLLAHDLRVLQSLPDWSITPSKKNAITLMIQSGLARKICPQVLFMLYRECLIEYSEQLGLDDYLAGRLSKNAPLNELDVFLCARNGTILPPNLLAKANMPGPVTRAYLEKMTSSYREEYAILSQAWRSC